MWCSFVIWGFANLNIYTWETYFNVSFLITGLCQYLRSRLWFNPLSTKIEHSAFWLLDTVFASWPRVFLHMLCAQLVIPEFLKARFDLHLLPFLPFFSSSSLLPPFLCRLFCAAVIHFLHFVFNSDIWISSSDLCSEHQVDLSYSLPLRYFLCLIWSLFPHSFGSIETWMIFWQHLFYSCFSVYSVTCLFPNSCWISQLHH